MPYFVIIITSQYVYIGFDLPSIHVVQFSLNAKKIPILLFDTKKPVRMTNNGKKDPLRKKPLHMITHDNLCRSKADQLLASTK